MKLGKLAAIMSGLTLLAPAAWSHSRGVDMTEGLAEFMGMYRLVEHRHGECAPTMMIGLGRDAYSFRAGPYEIIGLGLGKQRINNGEWRGWVESKVGGDGVETKSERRSVYGTWVREELELEQEDGMIELEYKRDVRSHRNKQKVRNKCFYVKSGGGELPEEDSPDKGGQDDGQQDKGQQGKGPIGK